MKAILFIMLLVGIRLIYAVIFEYPSLFVGFIGVSLSAFCIFALAQEFRKKGRM